MEQNICTNCPNIICLFKNSINEYSKEIEHYNIKSGATIFLEGSVPIKGLYVVQKGCINEYHIGKKGQKEISHTAKQGEIFGHKDLNATKHLLNATAAEDSSICLINNNTLIKMCGANTELSLQLIHFFSNELNKSDKKYQQI